MKLARFKAVALLFVVGAIAFQAQGPYRNAVLLLADLAAIQNHPRLLSFALALGADPNAEVPNAGRKWDTPLILVPLSGTAPSAAETLAVLVAHGADVNVRDTEGRTPLMVAPFWYGADEIAVLLRAGADPNLEDPDGNTALYYATGDATEWLAQARLLLAAGADPCHKNHQGKFVIAHASYRAPEAAALLERCRRKAMGKQ